MLTEKWIKTFLQKEKEVSEMKKELIQKAKEILIWENENIGGSYDINDQGVHYSCQVEIGEKTVCLNVKCSWAYGGYDENDYEIPLSKFFCDDWKEAALAEYQDQLQKKEQEKAEKTAKRERAEYERLKAKFENTSPSLTM